MNTIHVRVEGRVQGVFFRKFTRNKADSLGLKGWVQNMPDGAVEAVFQGNIDILKQMTDWLYTGSPQSRVTDVIVTTLAESDNFTNFKTRY